MTQDVQRGPLTCVWRRKCRVRHLAPPQHVSGSGCCSRCRKPGLAQPALTVLVLRLQVWHRGVVGLVSPGASQTSVVPVSSRGAPPLFLWAQTSFPREGDNHAGQSRPNSLT